jgi:predicted metalloenzyme YecM
MKRDIEILEKYYDQISENIKLGLSPILFALKCVKDHKEEVEKEWEVSYEDIGRDRSDLDERKLNGLNKSISKELVNRTEEGKIRVLQKTAKMIDIIRG